MNIWTDGSCSPNPGLGGWAWINEDTGEQDCGGEQATTNNRMEMLAIHHALSKLPNGKKVTIYSDSQYCINGLTTWRNGWKKKNWMKGSHPMINRDLWLMLDEQISRLDINFKWVKGHSGNVFNDMVDRLAAQGREKLIGAQVAAKAPVNEESNTFGEMLNALKEAKTSIQKLELLIVNQTQQRG